MKKLGKINFSEAKEMTKNEQKKLKGGSIYGCTCQCTDGVGVWHSYTSDGNCPGSGVSTEYCGGSGAYVCQ